MSFHSFRCHSIHSDVISFIPMSFRSFWCHSIHSNLISSFRCHSIHSNIISSFWCHSIHSDVTPEFLHWDDRTRWKWERFLNQGQSLRFFSWGPLDQWEASILSSRPIGSPDFGSQNFGSQNRGFLLVESSKSRRLIGREDPRKKI